MLLSTILTRFLKFKYMLGHIGSFSWLPGAADTKTLRGEAQRFNKTVKRVPPLPFFYFLFGLCRRNQRHTTIFILTDNFYCKIDWFETVYRVKIGTAADYNFYILDQSVAQPSGSQNEDIPVLTVNIRNCPKVFDYFRWHKSLAYFRGFSHSEGASFLFICRELFSLLSLWPESREDTAFSELSFVL